MKRTSVQATLTILVLIYIALGTCGWFGDYSGRDCYRSAEDVDACLEYAADRRLSP